MKGMLKYKIPNEHFRNDYVVYYSPLVPEIQDKNRDVVLNKLREYYSSVGIEYTDEEILSEIIHDNPNAEFTEIRSGQGFWDSLELNNWKRTFYARRWDIANKEELWGYAYYFASEYDGFDEVRGKWLVKSENEELIKEMVSRIQPEIWIFICEAEI